MTGQDNGSGKTWNDAMTECRAAGGVRPDLASIVDAYQMCKFGISLFMFKLDELGKMYKDSVQE